MSFSEHKSLKEVRDITNDIVREYEAAEVAKQLQIAPTTVRKYSQLFEKISEDKEYYKREPNTQQRKYSEENISEFQEVIKLKDQEGLALEKAIQKVVGKGDTATQTGYRHENMSTQMEIQRYVASVNDKVEGMQQEIASLKNLIEVQAEAFQQLAKESNRLNNTIEKLAAENEKQQLLLQEKEQTDSKEKDKSWLARLFKK